MSDLRAFLFKITGLSDFSRESLSDFVGAPIPEHGLSDKELDVFVLYFAVTRRSFVDKSLSTREVMFIKAVQSIVTGMLTKLTIAHDVHSLFDRV